MSILLQQGKAETRKTLEQKWEERAKRREEAQKNRVWRFLRGLFSSR